MRIVSASPEHASALSALFARADVACHCRYWHFSGDTNAWLDRSAHARDTNRTELETAITTGSPEGSGVVALAGADVVGWLKLAPETSVTKLYAQRVYRKLPCFEGDRDRVFAVGCLLVDPAWRRRGVADALIRGAVDAARSRGAHAVEAFPRRAAETRDDEIWMGPYSSFARAGFQVVHDFGPYPVMRLVL